MRPGLPWEAFADVTDFLPFSIYAWPVAAEVLQQEYRETLAYQLSVTFNWDDLMQDLEAKKAEEERAWIARLLDLELENKLLMQQILALR